MLIDHIRPHLHEFATPPPISSCKLTGGNPVNYFTRTEREKNELLYTQMAILSECFYSTGQRSFQRRDFDSSRCQSATTAFNGVELQRCFGVSGLNQSRKQLECWFLVFECIYFYYFVDFPKRL
jgi:hypothetical protein